MMEDDSAENEWKKPRIEDSAQEDRQPDPDTIAEEQMDEDGVEADMGPMSSGMLLALLRRAIREEGVAKR